MPKVFISYRRDESQGYAGRLHERLADLYGTDSVFMDVDDIGAGADFAHVIDNHIAACDVLLVLISKQWLTLQDAGGRRRVDDPNDFVRIEIARALARKIRIIPLLLNNASMPAPQDLPNELKGLTRHQAIELTEKRWEYDFHALAETIKGGSVQRKLRRKIIVAIAGVAAASVASVLWLREPAVLVTGRWTATVEYDRGRPFEESFVLEQDGAEIRGTASYFRVPRGITEGKVDGDRISFVTRTSEINGDENREVTHRYDGKRSDSEIQFTMQTTGGFSDDLPVPFIARRAGNNP